jgi:hypothetical protein
MQFWVCICILDILVVVANTLLDASCTGSSFALASLDVCHAFASLIRPLMLLKALKRGLNLAIIRSQGKYIISYESVLKPS